MLFAAILTNIFGVLIFLFILWKRLKDDFASDIIFRLGFAILAGVFFGQLIAWRFMPDYFLWLGFMCGILGLSATVLKFKSKFYEIFEAFIISALPWLGFVFLFDSVRQSSLSSFLGFVGILVLIFVSYFLNANYKNFSWYKSGRIGFSGIATLGIIFMSRFILAIFRISMVSFVSKFEVILSGLGILVCIILLINLGKTKE